MPISSAVLQEIAHAPADSDIKLGYTLARLSLDSNKRIELLTNPLVDALKGVDGKRVRECKNDKCRVVFWARRFDQVCCSRKCAHILRSQRYRDRYADTYKQSRLKQEQKSRLRKTACKVVAKSSAPKKATG
jgi:hypothetical protein